ncbi:MAG: glycosyltransferase family 4 protein [Pyrinomonadaceae bacterium]|nr:glycosyltransferase family 4 protein [Pyrinomonadaceae bacterium]
MSLRIVELGPIPPPEGGVSRHIAALRDISAARGHQCTLISTTRVAPESRQDGNLYPQSPVELVTILRESDAEIFHLHVGGEISLRVLALALAVAKTAKHSVLTMHSGGFPEAIGQASIFRRKFTASILKKFDRVIAVTDEIAAAIRDLGVTADAVETIPPYALHLPDQNVRLAKELDDFIGAHSPLIVAVGGLETEYAPLEQIDAVKILIEDLPNLGLVIAGEGGMREAVVKAATDAGLNENVHLPGNLDHGECLHLLQKADISLRTTRFDGDAISVRESLFLGTPVLATRAGTRPDGVQFIEELSPAAIAAGIRKTLALPRREKGGVQDDLSQIERVVELYERIIGL